MSVKGYKNFLRRSKLERLFYTNIHASSEMFSIPDISSFWVLSTLHPYASPFRCNLVSPATCSVLSSDHILGFYETTSTATGRSVY